MGKAYCGMLLNSAFVYSKLCLVIKLSLGAKEGEQQSSIHSSLHLLRSKIGLCLLLRATRTAEWKGQFCDIFPFSSSLVLHIS